MTRRQWVMTVIAACMVAVASYATSSAVSSRRMSAAGAGMGPGMTPLVSFLRLAAEQEDRVRPIDEAFRKDQMTACAEMQDARARLLEVLKQPNTSKTELDTALADVASAQGRLQRQTAEYLLEIKPILTDEQKDRLFSLVGQRFCGQGRCGTGICPAGGGPGRGGRCGRSW